MLPGFFEQDGYLLLQGFHLLIAIVDVGELTGNMVAGGNEFCHRIYTEFLLQGVELVETGVDGFQTVGVEVNTIHAVADFLGDVFQFDITALHAVGNLGHARIHLTNIFQLVSSGFQFVEYAVVVAAQGVVCLVECGLDVLAVAQGFCFLFQLLKFSFLQLCIFQFLQLESHELLVLSVFENLFLQIFQLNLCLMVGLVILLIGCELLIVLSDDVHHVELEVFLLQQQVLVLRMDVYELFAQLSHPGEGHRSIVDEGTAFACRRQLSSDDGVVAIVVDVVVIEERLHSVSRKVEMGFYHAAVSACLDGLGVGSVTQEQTDGAEDDALSGSGFSSDDGEARIECDIQLVDECEVLDI